jgi:hypothetical protein
LKFKTTFELIWEWKIENKEKQKKENKSPGPWSSFLAHLGLPRQPNPRRQPIARACALLWLADRWATCVSIIFNRTARISAHP